MLRLDGEVFRFGTAMAKPFVGKSPALPKPWGRGKRTQI